MSTKEKLFKVNVSINFDTVFYGREEEIIALVKEQIYEPYGNFDCVLEDHIKPDIKILKEILDTKDLPDLWEGDCLPWNSGEEELTIAEILEKQ